MFKKLFFVTLSFIISSQTFALGGGHVRPAGVPGYATTHQSASEQNGTHQNTSSNKENQSNQATIASQNTPSNTNSVAPATPAVVPNTPTTNAAVQEYYSIYPGY